MRPKRNRSYSQTRCALTARLRWRVRQAEARAEEAEEMAEAAEARAAAVYHEMKAERAALIAYIESPEWERDLLILARDRVRAELLNLAAKRQSCPSCGSFGRGFSEHFLQAEIEAITREHNLPFTPRLPSPDWPVRMGRVTKDGRGLSRQWLEAGRL